MQLIGIIGKARTGKDTVAQHLQAKHGFQIRAFADPFKDMLEAAFGDLFRERPGQPPKNREQEIPWLGKSPRQLMQTLGTEWGREQVHPDLWVKLMGQYWMDLVLRAGLAREKGKIHGLAIPDVRFHSEADWVLAHGGRLLHLHRPEDQTQRVNPHVSEQYDWTGYPTHVLHNDGSLGELHRKIDCMFLGESV